MTAEEGESPHVRQSAQGILRPTVHAAGTTRCQIYKQSAKTSAAPAKPPVKRKRTSVAPPSEVSVEHSEVLNLVHRPWSPIPDADLPVASQWTPRPQPSTAPVQDDSPLQIHGRKNNSKSTMKW